VTAVAIETAAELPAYAEPLFAAHRYKVLYGGRGAGRSWAVARTLLIRAANTPTRVGCFREFQKSIADSVHRLLRDQIERLGLPGYVITDREIRHANGSLFLFEGLRHNVTKIKSLEGIDVAWVEEAERVSNDSWNVLIPTVRKPGSEIWVTFNPDLETDPTYARFVATPPPDAWVQKVSADDNPWLPKELADERAYLMRVDPDAAAWVWGGECRRATDAQILRGKWRVEAFEPEEGWAGPYYGCDFGFAVDPNALVECWIAPGTIEQSTGRLMIRREAYKVGEDTDHIPAHWMRAVPGCERHVIRADSARPETISYLRRHGLPKVEGAPKWTGSVEDGIAHLRQYEAVVIHPDCPHVAEEARLYAYKVDQQTGDVLPVVVDKHNHTIDAIRYALAPRIKRRGISSYQSVHIG
jgi:phage terminase large subunit